jgi:hypothetical protein
MDNLTPDQRRIPARYRARAYARLPMTCDAVHALLEEAGREFQQAFRIPEEDYPAIDAIVCRTFLAIRDRVTQPFRTEQMRLLQELGERPRDPPLLEGLCDQTPD